MTNRKKVNEDWFIEGSTLDELGSVIDTEDRWSDLPHYRRLLCPVCRDTYNHVGSPRQVPSSGDYGAGWGGRGGCSLSPLRERVATTRSWLSGFSRVRRSPSCVFPTRRRRVRRESFWEQPHKLN